MEAERKLALSIGQVIDAPLLQAFLLERAVEAFVLAASLRMVRTAVNDAHIQPQRVRPDIGTAPDLGSITTASLFARPDDSSSTTGRAETGSTRIINSQSKLPHTAQKLIGREAELEMLNNAWDDSHKNVVVVGGKGEEGKTSLVAAWMAELAMEDWRGAEWVLDWPFYSQGTRDQSTASGEAFTISALGHIGDPNPN